MAALALDLDGGGGAASSTSCIVVPAVYWQRVRNPRIRTFTEFSAAIPFVLPFVVIAFGILKVIERHASRRLLGTPWIIWLGHAAIAFPFLYWAVDGAMAAANVVRSERGGANLRRDAAADAAPRRRARTSAPGWRRAACWSSRPASASSPWCRSWPVRASRTSRSTASICCAQTTSQAREAGGADDHHLRRSLHHLGRRRLRQPRTDWAAAARRSRAMSGEQGAMSDVSVAQPEQAASVPVARARRHIARGSLRRAGRSARSFRLRQDDLAALHRRARATRLAAQSPSAAKMSPRHPPRKRSIGMVFQSYVLFPNMTIRENVGFPLKVRGETKREIADRVDDLIELVGLNGAGGPLSAPGLGRSAATRRAGAGAGARPRRAAARRAALGARRPGAHPPAR